MSLIETMMDECVIMNKITADDGEGGSNTTWEEGAHILVAITHDTSINAMVAQKEGVTSVFTLTTHKDVVLDFHDVIKRVRDGRIFRVTSDSGNLVTPDISMLDIAQVKAEKWSLTT